MERGKSWECFEVKVFLAGEMCIRNLFPFFLYLSWLHHFAEEHDVPSKTINSFHQIDIECDGGSNIDDIRERICPFCFVSGVDILVHLIYFRTTSHRRSCNWRVWHLCECRVCHFLCDACRFPLPRAASSHTSLASNKLSRQTQKLMDGAGWRARTAHMSRYNQSVMKGKKEKRFSELTECIVNRDGEVWPKFMRFLLCEIRIAAPNAIHCYHHCFLSTSFQLFTC